MLENEFTQTSKKIGLELDSSIIMLGILLSGQERIELVQSNLCALSVERALLSFKTTLCVIIRLVVANVETFTLFVHVNR